jgi:HK97 family phage major capsid protein
VRTTEELRARHAELVAALEVLATKDGDLDETERADWDAGMTEAEAVAEEIKGREERASRFKALAASRATEVAGEGDGVVAVNGDGAAGAEARRAEFQVMQSAPSVEEIFDRSRIHTVRDEDGVAFRDKALRSLDTWDKHIKSEHKESATKLLERCDTSLEGRRLADHILETSRPEYIRAFNDFIRNGTLGLEPAQYRLLRETETLYRDPERAMNEGSNASGGFIVPPFLDPAIILTNTGINNPFREIATVKTITTQTWKGVTSAGVTAEWTAEASEMTDASPSLVQPTITPVRADAYVQASFEMLEDTDIATELAMLFADARDILEGTAFAVGTGSTQPYGIVTELQLVTASRTSANTNGSLGAVDVFNLGTNLPARWQANASFVAHRGIQNLLRALATGPSQAQSAFWADFGQGLPSKLTGYPIYLASGMQSFLSAATASNDDVLVLGDFRAGYYIIDRIGMSVAYNPLVIGSNRRPTGEVGWAAFWRTGARAVAPQAFQLLRV